MKLSKIQIAILACVALLFLFIGRCSVPHQAVKMVETKTEKATLWTCSMHPEISLPTKGNCPICGMELIEKGAGTAQSTDGVTLPLTPRELLRLDLATELVSGGTSGATHLTLFGTVETDPATEKTITSRVSGRIEQFFAAVPGTVIRAGQPIATIYSPELHQLVQELKLSSRDTNGVAASMISESAQKRFELLGFSPAEIKKILRDPSGGDRITIRADRGGVVVGSMNSMVREGVQIMMGEPLVKLADISRPVAILWLNEKDFSQMKAGTSVNLSTESVPGKIVTAKINSIDPVIDPMTRAARVRISIPANSGFIPGMSISASVAISGGSGLSIPVSAPLITGSRAIVYVEKSRNDSGAVFEAREIVLGAKSGDRFMVISGLSDGEKVVVRGAFLLDSELQIRGGKSLLSPLRDSKSEDSSDKPQVKSEKNEPLVESEKSEQPVKTAGEFIPLYLPIWKALSSDDFAAAQAAWKTLADQKSQFPSAISSILNLPVPAEINSLRESFGKLSKAIIDSKPKLPAVAKPAFCPMAFGTGAPWIQTGDSIANPYYGKKMLRCGDFTGGSK